MACSCASTRAGQGRRVVGTLRSGGFDSHRVHVLAQDYPWAVEPVAGWVAPQGVVPAAPIPVAELHGRTAVLAVGSNASPTVLTRKLGEQLHDGVALLPVQVRGMAIGHSAHVSIRGYVPAAPARQAQATTAATLTWFTPAQAELIDATELNYSRRALPASVRVSAATHLDPGGPQPWEQTGPVQVYDSDHGVLAEAHQVLTLRSQAEVLDWVNARLGGPDLEPEDLLDDDIRAGVRAELFRLNLRQDSGLA